MREFHLDRSTPYFDDYVRRLTDVLMLARLVERQGRLVAERLLRASEIAGALGETNNPEWKTVAIDEASDALVAPLASVGFRWGESGKWNLEEKNDAGRPTRLRLSLAGHGVTIVPVDFPYFGGRAVVPFVSTAHGEILTRNVPIRTIAGADGEKITVATLYDLVMANYGLDRGFGGGTSRAAMTTMHPSRPPGPSASLASSGTRSWRSPARSPPAPGPPTAAR